MEWILSHHNTGDDIRFNMFTISREIDVFVLPDNVEWPLAC